MNKVIKVMLRRFVFVLLFATPILNAGRGSSFGSGFLGSMTGSMFGSAMMRPRTKTVVIKETGSVTRDEIRRLEQSVRFDLNRLYDRQRENEFKIRDLEDEVARLKRLLNKLNR